MCTFSHRPKVAQIPDGRVDGRGLEPFGYIPISHHLSLSFKKEDSYTDTLLDFRFYRMKSTCEAFAIETVCHGNR